MLYPGMKFRVMRPAFVRGDGYMYVGMVEEMPILIA